MSRLLANRGEGVSGSVEEGIEESRFARIGATYEHNVGSGRREQELGVMSR